MSGITSEILLKDPRVKHVIVRSLLGLCASGCMYPLERCDWAYEPISNVVYLPKPQHYEDLPPILVVVQSVIDSTFMEKLIKYCLSLNEEYQVLPVVLIILVEGFSSQEIKSKFKPSETVFLMEANSQFWAKRCFIISPESIHDFIDECPLNKLLALASCFIDTNKSSQSDDPSIKYFMNIVNEKE